MNPLRTSEIDPPARRRVFLSQLLRTEPSPVSIAPILLWLLLQLTVLMVSAFRVPLWAQAPQASESLALDMLLGVQIGMSAMLFPWLMRTARMSLVAIATIWPFVFFAGILSAIPMRPILIAGGYGSAWLIALALFALPLSTTRPRLITSAIVSLWALGGPMLLFVHTEYGGGGPLGYGSTLLLGPFVNAHRAFSSAGTSTWGVPLLACGVGTVAACMSWFIHYKQKLEKRELSPGNSHQIL
jgi:hypothetical protein